MIQIDSTAFKQGLYLSVCARLAVDCVSAGIILESLTCDNELRSRDDFEVVWARLYKCRQVELTGA